MDYGQHLVTTGYVSLYCVGRRGKGGLLSGGGLCPTPVLNRMTAQLAYQEVKKFNTSIARTDGMVNQRAGTYMLAPADTSGVASSLVLTLFTARRRYA